MDSKWHEAYAETMYCIAAQCRMHWTKSACIVCFQCIFSFASFKVFSAHSVHTEEYTDEPHHRYKYTRTYLNICVDKLHGIQYALTFIYTGSQPDQTKWLKFKFFHLKQYHPDPGMRNSGVFRIAKIMQRSIINCSICSAMKSKLWSYTNSIQFTNMYPFFRYLSTALLIRTTGRRTHEHLHRYATGPHAQFCSTMLE